MKLSYAEENYLKAIYRLSRQSENGTSTNEISHYVETKASSVTDMLKRLAKKEMVNYKPYQPITITEKGRLMAIKTIRKHRLWEVFLVEKLNFKWDEVHEIAEELEHIHSDKLINRLDDFLNNPTHDPHGDPIPDADGNIEHHKDITIADLTEGQIGMIIGLKDTSSEFLQFLDNSQLTLGKSIKVEEITGYDGSVTITINMTTRKTISHQVAKNLYIKKLTR
ncbi:metal-dependent transcriptional regulator [Salibacter halophilus]|jgi:DtxR family Mn-dependent transcriptional regulator|uniref:Transcriptional regulator MntR n=1 Tax=Salibacter halophilus TaxID=1803916 RepID=A0A6N6M735_9FLAO|nr:metal-dependent transcriptional regulator [Salibacter halophilus]KAB1065734.1 metal-dependent transcriptional regulator [Salibacter halophilus]